MSFLLRERLHGLLPTYWSRMLAWVALTSLAVTIVSGVYLALYFNPSMSEVSYHGPIAYLRNVPMTGAYASVLDISFGMRGGLFVRQLHNWSASLFIASVLVVLATAFFTGVFRQPRRWLWISGVLVLLLGIFAAYTGVLVVDDGASGTSLRVVSGYTLSIPVLGTRLNQLLFGGGFPGTQVIKRLYVAHFLLAGLSIAVIALIAIRVRRQHVPRPSGPRPRAAAPVIAICTFTAALLAAMAGMIQVNPVWLYGPADFADAAGGSTPPWYLGWLDGAVRLWPAWDLHVGRYTIPAPFWPSVVLLGLTFVVAALYPWIDQWLTRGESVGSPHRPRDAPRRTAIGAGVVAFYSCLQLAGGIDVIAANFHLSADGLFWTLRLGVLVVPPLAATVAHRLCLGLQQHEKSLRQEGIETGIIRRLPNGGYVAEHRPLPELDGGQARELEPSA